MDNLQPYKISLDFYIRKIITVNAKQLDSDSRIINITCTENGKKFFVDSSITSAFVRYKKSDGYAVLNQVDILEDGTVNLVLTQQMLAVEGRHLVDIMLINKSELEVFMGNISVTDDGEGNVAVLNYETKNITDMNVEEILMAISENGIKVLSTMSFYINTEGVTIDDSEIESSYEYNALVEGLGKMVAVDNRMTELESTIKISEAKRQVAENGEYDENGNLIKDGRIQAEAKRINNESQRQINEQERQIYETSRIKAEKLRDIAENGEYDENGNLIKDGRIQTMQKVVESASEANNAATNANNAAQEVRDILYSSGIVNVQSDWNESTETSDAFIKNKPNLKVGSGEKSIVIGDGDATGKNSIAGGSNDSDEIDKVKKMAQLAGYTVDTDNPTTYGDGSLALGVGAKAHSMGSIAIGISNSAGVKGFYWHSIDWSGTYPVIQLSTEQKPYRTYRIALSDTIVHVNQNATWNETASNKLSDWKVGDLLTIVNNTKYAEQIVIKAIDSVNGKVTVASLPFTQSSVKVHFANYNDIASLVLLFDDYSVYNPSKPASGIAEFAYGALSLGLMTNAAGSFSTALGYRTKVTTDFGHAEGKETVAGYASHSEGSYTKATGLRSHTEGNHTIASNEEAHAEGYQTEASGLRSHAEGNQTKATEHCAHAEGCLTVASGNQAHAEGYGCYATGKQTHAEGDGTTASGEEAHAEGKNTTASGLHSHAEGYKTEASARATHAEGYECIADFLSAHAEGYQTAASGLHAHAEGCNTTAGAAHQHVQGAYNITDWDGDYSHIVGNGYIDSNNNEPVYSNAHTLDWEGNAWYQGSVTSNGADYAEFFEWQDGNLDNEDRVGLLVTLDGEKIKLANSEDEILGIISGTAAMLGDNYECEWNDKYLTDEFGRVIYDMVEEFIDVENITYKEVEKEIVNEETNETSTEIVLEEVVTVEKKSLGFFKHPQLNPEYDETQEYVNRANRPEWDAVGMLGKLYVRDDGTATVNGYATVGENGIATESSEKTNMRVLSRVNENIVRVLLK